MRAFVAVDVPAPTVPSYPQVHPEDHLTLHFFADLTAEQLPLVLESLREAADGVDPFDLELRGVGAFPDARRPRVVWAGVRRGADELHTIEDRFRRALTARRIASDDRPYVPHLTLGRIRSPASVVWARRLLMAPEMTDRLWAQVRVSELRLKESQLLPTGALHTTRARVPLGHRGVPEDGRSGAPGPGPHPRPPADGLRPPPVL